MTQTRAQGLFVCIESTLEFLHWDPQVFLHLIRLWKQDFQKEKKLGTGMDPTSSPLYADSVKPRETLHFKLELNSCTFFLIQIKEKKSQRVIGYNYALLLAIGEKMHIPSSLMFQLWVQQSYRIHSSSSSSKHFPIMLGSATKSILCRVIMTSLDSFVGSMKHPGSKSSP